MWGLACDWHDPRFAWLGPKPSPRFVVALLSEASRGSVVLTWYVLARPKGSPALHPAYCCPLQFVARAAHVFSPYWAMLAAHRGHNAYAPCVGQLVALVWSLYLDLTKPDWPIQGDSEPILSFSSRLSPNCVHWSLTELV